MNTTAFAGQDVFAQVPPVVAPRTRSEIAYAVAYRGESLLFAGHEIEVDTAEEDALLERRLLIHKGAESPDAAGNVWYDIHGEQETIGDKMLHAFFVIAERGEAANLPKELFDVWVEISEVLDRHAEKVV